MTCHAPGGLQRRRGARRDRRLGRAQGRWARFDAALAALRLGLHRAPGRISRWIERVASLTRLLNPPPVVRWNADKHYLLELARAGLPVVASSFAEAEADCRSGAGAIPRTPSCAELVVKPAVGAGARATRRHGRTAVAETLAHMRQLLAAGAACCCSPTRGVTSTAPRKFSDAGGERLLGPALISIGHSGRTGHSTVPDMGPPDRYLMYEPRGTCACSVQSDHPHWRCGKATDAEKLRSYDVMFAYCGIRSAGRRTPWWLSAGKWFLPHYVGTTSFGASVWRTG